LVSTDLSEIQIICSDYVYGRILHIFSSTDDVKSKLNLSDFVVKCILNNCYNITRTAYGLKWSFKRKSDEISSDIINQLMTVPQLNIIFKVKVDIMTNSNYKDFINKQWYRKSINSRTEMDFEY